MVKRGRKKTTSLYFDVREEEAVVRFIMTDDFEERSKIYKEFLEKPIEKLVESIIRRYKLYRKSYTYEEIHGDTISFLMLQMGKFRPEDDKKAYSYYGTICKNYVIALIQKDSKNLKNNNSFDDYFSSIEEREDLTYNMDDSEYTIKEFINSVAVEIKSVLDDTTLEGKKKLTENEVKLGNALIEILENWEVLFDSKEGNTSKYDKNTVLATIRNYTNLSTKDIRVAMGRFKILYKIIKNDKIKGGLI